MIERIGDGTTEYAIVIRNSHTAEGIQFFTPDDYSQQLAYMNRPKDYVIEPHRHNKVPRNVEYTQEVLFIRKGRVRVNFYDDDNVYVANVELSTGDVVLMVAGGHGIEMLESTEIIEVKQGPFLGDKDKTHLRDTRSEG